MKNLILFLCFFVSSHSIFGQAVVLDGKKGTTQILPAGIKTKAAAVTLNKVAAPKAATVTAAATPSAYSVQLNSLYECRILRQNLVSVTYEDEPNKIDNEAFNQLRDYIKSNFKAKGFSTFSVSISPQSIEQISTSIGYMGRDSMQIKQEYQDRLSACRFSESLKRQKEIQDAKVSKK